MGVYTYLSDKKEKGDPKNCRENQPRQYRLLENAFLFFYLGFLDHDINSLADLISTVK